MFAAPGTIWLVPLAMILGMTGVACVEVNGGAAELSWSLRTFDGVRLATSCDDREHGVHLQWIRLAWKAAADSGDETDLEPDGWKQFRCADARGVTDFSIPPGKQMLWVVPICADGMPATGNYQVPPPIVRTVAHGAVTTLDALLVVADASTCPAP